MNWYKYIKANAAMLSQILAGWLNQAAHGTIDMHLVHRDVDRVMAGPEDPQELEGAVMQAETQYRAMSGELMPAQADLLNNVRLRLRNPVQPPPDMGGENDVQSFEDSI